MLYLSRMPLNWMPIKKFCSALLLLFPLWVMAQAMPPLNDVNHSVLLTGFAVNKPAQLTDVDNIALGLPREIARRLEQSQQFNVRTIPELLSTDWVLNPPSAKLLAQTANTYDVRYVISGDVRNAGMREIPVLFGLWSKKVRSIEIDLSVYDARAGKLMKRYSFTAAANGDVLIGKEYVFGGDEFSATPYGKAILNVADQAAHALTANLERQP